MERHVTLLLFKGERSMRNMVGKWLASWKAKGLGLLLAAGSLLVSSLAFASEADLKLPDLSSVSFLGMPGHTLLTYGIFIFVT